MSCNDPFFDMEREVVKETWAKDIVNGKYPDIGFYAYTASSNPRIENNCIYVDTPDDLLHTYSKTISAMRTLRENGITWDMVVRTNTSTYINVKNMLEMVDRLPPNDFSSFGAYCMHSPYKNESFCLPTGWMMVVPHSLTDILIDEYDKFNENSEMLDRYFNLDAHNHFYSRYDDVLFGIFWYEISQQRPETNIGYTCFPFSLINHYKTEIHNKFIQPVLGDFLTIPSQNHRRPEVIHNLPFIQIRLFGVDTRYRYIELEHIYELHEEYKKEEP